MHVHGYMCVRSLYKTQKVYADVSLRGMDDTECPHIVALLTCCP
jgi:hypothetical protein